jgi:hypothetical protein
LYLGCNGFHNVIRQKTQFTNIERLSKYPKTQNQKNASAVFRVRDWRGGEAGANRNERPNKKSADSGRQTFQNAHVLECSIIHSSLFIIHSSLFISSSLPSLVIVPAQSNKKGTVVSPFSC